jgi:Putative beta-barrel porin 2
MRYPCLARSLACLAAVCAPALAWAQDITQNPGAGASLHLGSLALTPRAAIRDVGVDTNVLNAAGDPQKDFTATFATGADAWWTVARTRVTSKTDAGWVYYQQLANQRSFDFNEQARADLLLAQFVPYATVGYDHSRQRPNLEIDARALHTTTSGSAGSVLRLGARTTFDGSVAWRTFEFTEGQSIDNVRLATALNRNEQEVAGSLRVALTPLTTAVLTLADEHDRFEFSPIRDSDSVRVLPGLEFKPFALIAGKVSVGYRQFDALSPGVPDYSGLIAAIDASYTMREMTRFAVQFNRDVDYSFEVTSPYYVSTGGSVSVTQALGPDWMLIGRLGRTALAYRALAGLGASATDLASRRDVVVTYGAGVGRRLGSDMHLGIDVDRTHRDSIDSARTYSGIKLGGALTYGF